MEQIKELTNKTSIQKRYPRTILGTACIPWNEDYTFDESTFRELVRKLIESGLTHIYIFGTAGEGYAVTNDQFKEIVEVFAGEMKEPGLFPMVGIISLSQGVMIERIEVAYSYGIRDFMFALPAWGALEAEELVNFFYSICNPYSDCRFMHYNNIRSKKIISIKEYESLAEKIPNLIGAKYSTSNISDILSLINSPCPMQFFITEMGFGYASMFGECGLLVSIASINMVKAWEYFHAAVNRDFDTIIKLQNELFNILQRLLEISGSGKIDGAYDKLFCKAIISNYPLRLLPPYTSSSDNIFPQFSEFVFSHYPSWFWD